jgi:hypothetical protein
MKKSVSPFQTASQIKDRQSIGGSNPRVQNASEAMQDESVPFLATRIYASPALRLYDDTDPRFDGKSTAVENIYWPASVEEKRPSGVKQLWNWLTTGRLF